MMRVGINYSKSTKLFTELAPRLQCPFMCLCVSCPLGVIFFWEGWRLLVKNLELDNAVITWTRFRMGKVGITWTREKKDQSLK